MIQKNRWHFNRQINLSVLVQLVLLAGLIFGSWVNLQMQLEVLQNDMRRLLAVQEKFCNRLDHLAEKNISYEYRLQAAEEKLRIKD